MNVSKEAKECVKSMLKKDMKKRITVKELLIHPWLTSNCESLRELRQNATSESDFRMNSLQTPMDLSALSNSH